MLKKAYRRASLAVHPDKSCESRAEEAFVRVNEAYLAYVVELNKANEYDRAASWTPELPDLGLSDCAVS